MGFAFLAVTSYLALMQTVAGGRSDQRYLTVEELRNVSPGELSEVTAAAQEAFARNPLNARSLLQLSRVAEVQGDREAAERLKLLAGNLQPRALAIQAEALTILLQRRDFERALIRLDGLIRARPGRRDALFEVAAGIASDPQGAGAVARKLAEDPPWRRDFLAYTISLGKPQRAQQIMSELRAMGSKPSDEELALLINHHLKGSDVDAAYAAWLSSLTPEELDLVRLVYDGGFDGAIRSLSFDWNIRRERGLSYRLFPRNTATMDMTLQLEFMDFRGAFSHLSQILRLRPGRYRLSGETRVDSFQSASGMVFRLRCLIEGKTAPLAETSPLPQSSQWIAFETVFTVPTSGCTDQLLRLEIRGGSEEAGTTQGRVSLDNVTIDTMPGLAP